MDSLACLFVCLLFVYLIVYVATTVTESTTAATTDAATESSQSVVSSTPHGGVHVCCSSIDMKLSYTCSNMSVMHKSCATK